MKNRQKSLTIKEFNTNNWTEFEENLENKQSNWRVY